MFTVIYYLAISNIIKIMVCINKLPLMEMEGHSWLNWSHLFD